MQRIIFVDCFLSVTSVRCQNHGTIKLKEKKEGDKMKVSRILSTLIVLVSVCGCSSVQTRSVRDSKEVARSQTILSKLQDVKTYQGSLDETNKFALTAMKTLESSPGACFPWCGVTNVTIQGKEKHLVIALDGYGTFDFNFSEKYADEPWFDPLFGTTFPNDTGWHIVKGFELNGKKYGSWVFVLPGKVDLRWPPAAFRGHGRITLPRLPRIRYSLIRGNQYPVVWSRVETSLPLTELGLTSKGKISVLKFSSTTGEIVLYVPDRTQ